MAWLESVVERFSNIKIYIKIYIERVQYIYIYIPLGMLLMALAFQVLFHHLEPPHSILWCWPLGPCYLGKQSNFGVPH